MQSNTNTTGGVSTAVTGQGTDIQVQDRFKLNAKTHADVAKGMDKNAADGRSSYVQGD